MYRCVSVKTWSLVFAPLKVGKSCCTTANKNRQLHAFTQQAQKIKVDDLVYRPQTFYISAAYAQHAYKLQPVAIILQVQEAAWE